MNNRIIEIYNQAREEVSVHDGMLTPGAIRDKFAELIIKECSAVANYFSDGHEMDQYGRKMYHYTVDIGRVINKYFEVEWTN